MPAALVTPAPLAIAKRYVTPKKLVIQVSEPGSQLNACRWTPDQVRGDIQTTRGDIQNARDDVQSARGATASTLFF